MDMERVILVKGGKSNWFEQAIFIVKPGVSGNKAPMDMAAEAEKIINNYLHKPLGEKYAKPAVQPSIPKTQVETEPGGVKVVYKRSAFDKLLNVIMLISCSVLAGVLLYGFVR